MLEVEAAPEPGLPTHAMCSSRLLPLSGALLQQMRTAPVSVATRDTWHAPSESEIGSEIEGGSEIGGGVEGDIEVAGSGGSSGSSLGSRPGASPGSSSGSTEKLRLHVLRQADGALLSVGGEVYLAGDSEGSNSHPARSPHRRHPLPPTTTHYHPLPPTTTHTGRA